jgi:hypothetical protein
MKLHLLPLDLAKSIFTSLKGVLRCLESTRGAAALMDVMPQRDD